jgi:lipoyl(octanoyl) transferase
MAMRAHPADDSVRAAGVPQIGRPAVEYWGQVGYRRAWDRQTELGRCVADGRAPDTLVVVTHPPTITLGRNAPESDILFDAATLAARGIEVVRSDRGGRATYHGPGQIVMYPIVDIARLGLGTRAWVELLEDALLATIADFGAEGGRIAGRPGIWAAGAKVASLGLRILGGVSHHGVSLNVDLDVSVFDCIVPCGAAGERITSLRILTGRNPTPDEVAERLVEHVARMIEARRTRKTLQTPESDKETTTR